MTEYIPCHLAPSAAKRVRAANRERVTRIGLRAELRDESTVTEFVSASMAHRDGSWFTPVEVAKVYGPCLLEVYDLGRLVGVVEVDSLGKAVVR